MEEFAGTLWLCSLPPYSPEITPDELVWNHVTNHGIGQRTVLGPTHLRKQVVECLRACGDRWAFP